MNAIGLVMLEVVGVAALAGAPPLRLPTNERVPVELTREVGANVDFKLNWSALIGSEADKRRIGMASDRVELPGSRHPYIPGAQIEGPADPNLRIDVYVNLKRRAEPPEIGPSTPNLSREELAQRFGAAPALIARIVAFAREHGLQVVSANAETRTIQLAGTIADIETAFGVKLLNANINGRKIWYQEGPILLPPDVAEGVTAVLGLDDRAVARPR